MGTGYDFGMIGHLERWEQAVEMMALWRPPENGTLSREDIEPLYGWIPPREIFRVEAVSMADGRAVKGVYLETFIPPGSLGRAHFYANVERVKKAMRRAGKLGAGVVTLGGFSSILLEGQWESEPGLSTAFTTGNTLTAVLIVKALETAAERLGLDLGLSRLGVIGSTGDIGTGVCRYFAGRVQEMLLCARNRRRLEQQAAELDPRQPNRIMEDAGQAAAEADVLICVASTETPLFSLDRCRPGTLVCDAGYPKNIATAGRPVHLFRGGLGEVLGGTRFDPPSMHAAYHFPAPDVGHGCLLESVLLAMEGRPEAYSRGRGHITLARMEEIWSLARRHGIVPAPFMDENGLWPDHLQPMQVRTGMGS